jgi:hypothetical protein
VRDYRGYFDNIRDPRWGPSQVERPSTNGHGHPAGHGSRRVSGVSFSHDLSRPLQRREDRTPGDQARIDQAVEFIHDLARQLGRGGRWEER